MAAVRFAPAWCARLAPIARRLSALARDLEAFALPQRCPGCGDIADADRFLCQACLARVPRLSMAVCTRCLVRGRSPSGCLAHPDDQAWPAWIYDERVAALVHALKYRERPALARALGAVLANALPGGARWDLILAVPLHSARRRERGYNQAGLLADALAERIGTPRLEGALARVRPTQPQARLGPGARRANLAGAFVVRRPGWIAGRRVLIVDDVLTTGATLEACAASLAAAGARVTAVTLAWAQ
jgi:ComF family protein